MLRGNELIAGVIFALIKSSMFKTQKRFSDSRSSEFPFRRYIYRKKLEKKPQEPQQKTRCSLEGKEGKTTHSRKEINP